MTWLTEFLPILILLAVIVLVVSRLPKIEIGHTKAFRRRRFWNWFPLGMTYAFLYMGRYNLTVSKNALGDLMTKSEFGEIFAWGTLVYGFSFIINGPLTDRIGGRKTILLAAAGSSVMNIAMGVVTWGMLEGGWEVHANLVPIFSVLYGINMYFQSFGAVSIVKVNASWFHVRERGVFGGIFGILISLGIYFAFDWGRIIATHAPTYWVFFVPAIVLLVFLVIDSFVVRDTPGDAGLPDFDTADASSGDDGPQLPVWVVAKLMFRNPIILTIGAIEFCSGYLRNAIMHWYLIFAKQTGAMDTFVARNWGMMLCMAGILGGMTAGVISDHIFGSRRGPVAAVLYGAMVVGGLVLFTVLGSPMLGWVVVLMSMCVIGVHGMLSGTASMDFGGRRNVGVAVGLIDGLVYLGTAVQSGLLGNILPAGEAAQDPANWIKWPVAMLPVAVIGFLLALRVWNARPKPRVAATEAA